MAVLVLDKRQHPLMPCSEKRARLLLTQQRAVVHKRFPFTIRLKDRIGGKRQPLLIKLDPGSKHTGIALVRGRLLQTVLNLFQIDHRGAVISDALRARRSMRRRRRGKLRYRKARFNNRVKPKGWLPPSLRHRVDTVGSWVDRLRRLAPITGIAQELVKFDMQKMVDPEISGKRYQYGTLAGYEVRHYLLEKFKHRCVYCSSRERLEIEHIIPRASGGSNRVSNLAIACRKCNQAKGAMPVEVFCKGTPGLAAKVLAAAKRPLKDAAAVNATRWALAARLKSTGLPVDFGSGARTAWNRKQLGIPKDHALDAACTGNLLEVKKWQRPTLVIKCTGRGRYSRTRMDRYGFPRAYLPRVKYVHGFQTGDRVRATVPIGKYAGTHEGRVLVRSSGSFDISTPEGKIGVNWRYCVLIARNDGYSYRSNEAIKTPESRAVSARS